MFTFEGSYVDADQGPLLPPSTISKVDEFAQDLINKIGRTGSAGRKLGFAIGPLSFDSDDRMTVQLIRQAFAVARQKNLAVAIHIDDSMFWLSRRELWNDPASMEWLDFSGTRNMGRLLSWGDDKKLAPQMCLNSPMIQALVRQRAQLIGHVIATEVRQLQASGKGDLFAGVIAGWETQIGRDFDTRALSGFCALARRGFSKNKPPRNADFEREQVVREFIELWADALVAGGVERGRIYSHTAVFPKAVYEKFKKEHPALRETHSQLSGFAPPSVSISPKFNPGYSTYPDTGMYDDIYREVQKRPGVRWASAEGTNLTLGKPDAGGQTMENYLAKLYNHGASLVNIFAWGYPDTNSPFYKATASIDSIRAYRMFLDGKALVEDVNQNRLSTVGDGGR